VLLLTGATGLVGSPLLRRLIATGTPVRCLVRDPRRLGADRVHVQIALGDLADPPSFRNALRGIDTVVHLAAAARDQPAGSIEELNGIATWRMVQAAERAGVRRFVFFSALSASTHNRTRFLRSKALAEDAVVASSLDYVILAPSLIYAADDQLTRLVGHLSLLPIVPLSGSGRAVFQPIWADDVAACAMAVVRAGATCPKRRHELAGPDTLTAAEVVATMVRASGRSRRLLPVPVAVASRALRAAGALLRSRSPATWDEAELLEVSMLATNGDADARALGVHPRAMADVLAPAAAA
jgi:uncharacterized protein YbjT (DUF2867 family)